MRRKKNKYDNTINNRINVFICIIIALFIFLSLCFYDVMVLNKKDYSKLLDELTYSKVSGTSTPRGRIYDRNYNIIVDNKSLKTIIYKKKKGTTNTDMIDNANKLSNHINIDYSKLKLRNKKEYFCAKNIDYCNKLIKKKELEKLKQHKLTQNDLFELKLERIPEDKLNFTDEENKIAYIYYLMNKGYTYDEKIIKSDVSEEEYAYVSENNDNLDGFDTKIEWERVYPYGDTFKTLLGKVSSSDQGLPAEEKEYYLRKGYS